MTPLSLLKPLSFADAAKRQSPMGTAARRREPICKINFTDDLEKAGSVYFFGALGNSVYCIHFIGSLVEQFESRKGLAKCGLCGRREFARWTFDHKVQAPLVNDDMCISFGLPMPDDF